ncbi:MAG: anti-CBASS protein Acb1 family protein, partial [Thiohalomonadales bacterium]
TIRSKQMAQLDPAITPLDEVMVRSAIGHMPDGFDYTWNPLAQTNQIEEAQAQLLQAQKNRIYLEDAIITSSQIQMNLQSNEEYQFEEGEIEQTAATEQNNPFDIE